MSIIGAIQSRCRRRRAAGAEVLQHVGGAELRHPRIVEQVDVVLAGAVLRVGEEFLERDAVLVLAGTRSRSRSAALASGMILSLKGVSPPSAKAPMTTLPCPMEPRARRGLEAAGGRGGADAGAVGATPSCRRRREPRPPGQLGPAEAVAARTAELGAMLILVLLRLRRQAALDRRRAPSDPDGARPSSRPRRRSRRRAGSRRRRPASRWARRKPRGAAHVEACARRRGGRPASRCPWARRRRPRRGSAPGLPGLDERDVLGPHADLDQPPARRRPSCGRRSAGGGRRRRRARAVGVRSRPRSTFIGGLPTKVATKRLAGRS